MFCFCITLHTRFVYYVVTKKNKREIRVRVIYGYGKIVSLDAKLVKCELKTIKTKYLCNIVYVCELFGNVINAV